MREQYRKLQRALVRIKASTKSVAVQTDVSESMTSPISSPSSPSSLARRRMSGSEPQREPPENEADNAQQTQAAEAAPGEASPATTQFGLHEDQEAADDEDRWWNAGRGWDWNRSTWRSYDWHDWRSRNDDWQWKEDQEDTTPAWDETDLALPEILPPEVLGWLLLRRSGLSAQSRLGILSAAGNSLKIDDIERAMRLQEEEIMTQERQRSSKAPRTYWIEQEEDWGLVMQDSIDELDNIPESQVKWLDSTAFAATVLSQGDQPEPDAEPAWWSDGWNDWTWHEGDWYTSVNDSWISFSDMKPWMDVEDVLAVDHTAGKEVQDLLVAFDQKIRTFKESRDLMHAKGKSRGYYPISPKGSSKGKGKHKKGKNTASSAMMASGKGKGMSGNNVTSKPGYTGFHLR